MQSDEQITLDEKQKKLEDIIKGYGSVAVAFSGGVDSTLLLAVAHNILGDKAMAITAISPVFPRRERQEAGDFIEQFGIKWEKFNSHVQHDENFLQNDKDRCYYCKYANFFAMKKMAEESGAVLCEGSNVDDLSDYRPGHRAIKELDIKSPLLEAGLTKNEIRMLSRKMELPTSEKSAFACLATRIPTGRPITTEALGMIEAAEEAVRSFGFTQYRIRHYKSLAKLELLPEDLPRAFEIRSKLSEEIKAAGYKNAALDLDGYVMGNMN